MYAFEGIGLIMPVQDITDCPKIYNKIVYAVIISCATLFIFFGQFCVIGWGHKLTTPLITDQLPNDLLTYIVKILFCINLIFSYPLQLYPAHIIIENFLYVGWPKSKKRQWSKNLSRTLLVLFTIVFTMWMGAKVSKFLSILGALTCTPIAFSFPALFHYKAVAKTKREKNIDLAIFSLSMVILFYCTTMGFIQWND